MSANPVPGTYKTPQSVTLTSDNAGDIIYYTVDGSIPTVSSAQYTGNISVSSSMMIKTVAYNAGAEPQWGEVASFMYIIDASADLDAPQITANQTKKKDVSSISGISFTLTDGDSSSVTAYFTKDGREPSLSSQVYVSGNAAGGLTGPSFTVTSTTTYKFLVVDSAGHTVTKTYKYIIGASVSGDFREESIYFLMTTRFYDGYAGNNRYCWDGPAANKVNNDPEWRGDFEGLIEKLDYIKALGFSAIWITPHVENASGYDYHGYHALDFTKIDSRYATDVYTAEESYQRFIDACHEKGMKVVQDIVLNHTGNWGETNLYPMFKKGSDDGSMSPSMVEYDVKGKLAAGASMNGGVYSALAPNAQYASRISAMKTDSIDEDLIYHHGGSLSWNGIDCQLGQIAGDCVDLNTENPVVINYLIDAFNSYIDMGVDAFRIDTVKHINRLMFNEYYNPAFKSRGGEDFFMFGEVCARYRGRWNEGVPALSPSFYTWKDNDSYALGSESANSIAIRADFEKYKSSYNPPVNGIGNHVLTGNTYRTPDYGKYSGLSVIDFYMHWAFNNVNDAFNTGLSYDNDYNDATWMVTYIDSHDYAPDCAPENQRFAGSWPDKLNLLFTFRGIPCIYYGSEIEFKKGLPIDVGPNAPLENTGRAYFGSYLEGSVNASDFGKYTASGTIEQTLNHELAQHIIRLNQIRRAVPALQKGQYSTEDCSGSIAFKRRYTDAHTDSFALVAINGQGTFKNLPDGTYYEAITGRQVSIGNGGTIVSDAIGRNNMRVYVLATSSSSVTGKIGVDGKYLK